MLKDNKFASEKYFDVYNDFLNNERLLVKELDDEIVFTRRITVDGKFKKTEVLKIIGDKREILEDSYLTYFIIKKLDEGEDIYSISTSVIPDMVKSIDNLLTHFHSHTLSMVEFAKYSLLDYKEDDDLDYKDRIDDAKEKLNNYIKNPVLLTNDREMLEKDIPEVLTFLKERPLLNRNKQYELFRELETNIQKTLDMYKNISS